MAPNDYGAVFTGCVDVPLVWLVSWRPFGEINMSYILADQRDRDVVAAFAAYRKYLLERRSRYPPAAYALAASEWYFDFSGSTRAADVDAYYPTTGCIPRRLHRVQLS